MNTQKEKVVHSCYQRLEDLATMGYTLIDHNMLLAFSERWHYETSKQIVCQHSVFAYNGWLYHLLIHESYIY
jgi:hypothetical protein